MKTPKTCHNPQSFYIQPDSTLDSGVYFGREDKTVCSKAKVPRAPLFSKCKLLKGDDESLNAEENENEFNSLILPSKKQGSVCIPLNHTKKQKRAKPVHFYQEMHKHGLLEKIVHIEKLKNHLEIEFGSSNKKTSIQSTCKVSPSNKCNSSVRAYEFPFHKRTRSNSPIKNGSVLQDHCMSLAMNLKLVVPQSNFIIGKEVKDIKSQDDDFLLTESTNELKDPQDKEDEWIYQRICFKQEGSEDVAVEEDGVLFMQTLNQA